MENNFAATLDGRLIDELKSRTVQSKPYRPENGFEMKGLFLLIAAMCTFGVVLGFAVHWVQQWFYLIILFPVLMGVGMGKVGALLCKSQKVRNPWVGGAVGLLGGVFAMVVVHYMDYRSFMELIQPRDAEERAFIEAPEAVQNEALNDSKIDPAMRESWKLFLQAQKIKTFPDYMNYRANEGVSINKATSRRKGINLGYYGTWIYWLIEIGILAFVSWRILKETCNEPFCGKCENWKKVWMDEKAPLLPGDKTQLLTSLQQRTLGDFYGWVEKSVDKLKNPPPPSEDKKKKKEKPEPSFAFHFSHCDKCSLSSTFDVRVQEMTVNHKGEAKLVDCGHYSYPPEAKRYFVDFFKKIGDYFTPATAPA